MTDLALDAVQEPVPHELFLFQHLSFHYRLVGAYQMNRIGIYGLLFLSAGILTGCGGSSKDISSPTVSVSGKVTLNDKPLSGATVTFQPAETNKGGNLPTSAGTTNDAGEYSLSVVTDGTKGAVIGEHIVRITHPDDSQPEGTATGDAGSTAKKSDQLIPDRYSVNSELKFTVPEAGSTGANFTLKSP